MSLEQALMDATAAITRLTTVLVSATEAGAVAAPVAEKPARAKRNEPVQTATQPVQTATPPVQTATPPVQISTPLEGDPEGTKYFHVPAYNTVYKQLPGMPDCSVAGALAVSASEYQLQKDELAKKFPTANAAVTAPAATTAPTATAPVSAPVQAPASPAVAATFEQVIEKMRALFKAQGDAGVKVVLDKFGAARVPNLNGKASNEELIACIDSVTLGL